MLSRLPKSSSSSSSSFPLLSLLLKFFDRISSSPSSPSSSSKISTRISFASSHLEEGRRSFAGHSHWANIKRQKAVVDIKRANAFAKISLEITTAVRIGSSADPQMNPRLATALDKARSHNMPKETIESAIKKASQAKGEGGEFETLIYEGRGPGGSALVVECLTNNRHRTAQFVRTAFTKNGGTISAGGSSSFLFTKKGILIFHKGDKEEDKVMEDAMELGASELDFKEGSDEVLIECESESEETGTGTGTGAREKEVMRLKTGLMEKGYKVISAQVVTVPLETIQLEEDEEESKAFQKLLDALEDLDDVHNVYHNVTLS